MAQQFLSRIRTQQPRLWDIAVDVLQHGNMPAWKALVRQRALVDGQPIYMLLLVVDVVFRGIGQVYLCDHPLTGFFIFLGLCCTEARRGMFAVLGSFVATAASILLTRPNDSEVFDGLCGYDGTLIGVAVAVMVNPTHAGVAAFTLAAVGGMLRTGCRSLLGHLSLPAFTSAFNLVLTLFLAVEHTKLSRWQLAAQDAVDEPFYHVNVAYAFDATVLGVGQFTFADTVPGAVLVVLGCALASRRAAGALLLGSLVGWLVALYVVNVSEDQLVAVRTGLYGYNAAGSCAVVAGGVFYRVERQTVALGVVAAIWASFQTAGLRALLQPYPVLTIPFIFSSWLFLLSCEEPLAAHKLGGPEPAPLVNNSTAAAMDAAAASAGLGTASGVALPSTGIGVEEPSLFTAHSLTDTAYAPINSTSPERARDRARDRERFGVPGREEGDVEMGYRQDQGVGAADDVLAGSEHGTSVSGSERGGGGVERGGKAEEAFLEGVQMQFQGQKLAQEQRQGQGQEDGEASLGSRSTSTNIDLEVAEATGGLGLGVGIAMGQGEHLLQGALEAEVGAGAGVGLRERTPFDVDVGTGLGAGAGVGLRERTPLDAGVGRSVGGQANGSRDRDNDAQSSSHAGPKEVTLHYGEGAGQREEEEVDLKDAVRGRSTSKIMSAAAAAATAAAAALTPAWAGGGGEDREQNRSTSNLLSLQQQDESSDVHSPGGGQGYGWGGDGGGGRDGMGIASIQGGEHSWFGGNFEDLDAERMDVGGREDS